VGKRDGKGLKRVTWPTVTFSGLSVGDQASFSVRITDEMMEQFVELTGDRTPVHMDADFASRTIFEGRIVHGMLENALFSRLIGMHLTGGNGFCLSQESHFLRPIRPNTDVSVRGIVKSKSSATKTVRIETQILDEAGRVAVDGTVVAKMFS
jgi:3-hydroxybutyryl-CoA dehydratase